MAMTVEEKIAAANQALSQGASAVDQTGVVEDVVRGTGAGLRRGIEGIPGAPGDIAGLGRIGAAKLAQLLGADPETVKAITEYDIPYVPDISSNTIHEQTSKVLGESYEPKTTAGKFASSAAEFAPGFISPTGGIISGLKHAAIGAGAGLASEAAGEATAGTKYEPWARAGAGIVGGVVPSAVESSVKHIAGTAGREAEIAAEEAAKKGAAGVQLTKGQRTGDVSQQMAEQQMLKGGKGDWAQRLMVARDEENKRAIMEAATGFKDTSAPARGATPVDAGDLLNKQTQARADQLRKEGGAKIQSALESGVMLDAERLRGLPSELSGKLEGSTPFVPDVILDSTTPVASQAMERVQKFVQAAEDPNVKEVSMAGAEQLRRQLGKLMGSTNTDNRALGKIRKYFDDWYDTSIDQHSRVMPDPNALPGPGGARDPRDILADLKAGRGTSKEGLDIVEPRGKPPGGSQVADIGSGKRSPEETARLFKPNDAGNLSVQAIEAIDRLKKVGATTKDLDQVRAIVLDQLMTGDPGKVATRIDNFTRNNPTAAAALFEPDQLQTMKDWGSTNRKIVPDPKATNPSQSSFPVVKEMAAQGRKALTSQGGVIGSIVGGLPGAVIGAGIGQGANVLSQIKNSRAVKEALAAADRSTLAEKMVKGGVEGARGARVGATQGAQTMTVDDPGGEYDGQRGRIVEAGENMVRLLMPDGKIKQIGKALVK